ncbi:uncharacterized protein LOC116004106 [Ipomoea triloba]|uniref:uncharacterized protein LOC116004106 n=1 Tax=Ipomoea triloba TaxID=35885 RepID=UPI00125D0DCD|nr:uncharacterized protein LOC116004106 [Ipomoea triloba]
MQTLSERAAAEDCGQHYFLFTAIETTEKEKVEETGKQLQSFAAQFNLPFSFNVLYIPDLKHLKAEQVEIKADEAVVIHASFALRAMISKLLELENSSTHYTMRSDDQHRASIEAGSVLDGIRNIVAAEGRERVTRSVSLQVWRDFFGSYTPGSWTELVGGTNLRDYKVPKTTIILLIGTKGCGKSSLVNKISDVFESERFTPQRARVSLNPSVGGCTCFAHGYKIPSSAKSFCVYDAQSLSYNQSENENMLKHWMTNGVCHEESFIWCHAQKAYYLPIVARPINFVVFVVNAVSVLESMEGRDETEKRYTRVVSKAFNSPLLSFKDDRPVVVVTHGDLLSVSERVRVRVHSGDLLGIHPKNQIFDIPESNDCATKLAILDMLHYCLDHADQNLPLKGLFPSLFLQHISLLWLMALLLWLYALMRVYIYLDRILREHILK